MPDLRSNSSAGISRDFMFVALLPWPVESCFHERYYIKSSGTTFALREPNMPSQRGVIHGKTVPSWPKLLSPWT